MNPNQITLLASLVGATITVDSNGNFVVTTPAQVKTTYAASQIVSVLQALASYISGQKNALATAPNGNTLMALMATIASI